MIINRLANKRNIFISATLIIIAIALYWFSRQSNFSFSQLSEQIITALTLTNPESHLIANIALLLVILSLATACALPRQIAALIAGINFGATIGAITALSAATIGCIITFSVSRFLLSERITDRYPTQLAKLSAFLCQQTFIKTIIIRLLPAGSNFLTNIVAGVSKVSMKSYVSGSFIGFIPQMVIFSLAGSGIRLGAQTEMLASGILFLIALLLSAYLYRQHKKSQTKAL